MGSFYVNFSVRRDDPQRIANALKRAGCKAFITPPIAGYVVVFEAESDAQDTWAIEQVGTLLSREAEAPVLAVLNHDDDILCYWLFDDGQVIDVYNSSPDYFDQLEGEEPEPGGDAQQLAEVLSVPSAAGAIDAILRSDSMTADYRHEELAAALGLPACAVGLGYRYLQRGELPSGLSMEDLIHVG